MSNYYFTEEQYTAFQTYVAPYVQAQAKSLDIPTEPSPIMEYQKVFRAYVGTLPADPQRETDLSPVAKNNMPKLKSTDFNLLLSHDAATIPKDYFGFQNNPILNRFVSQAYSNVVQDADKIIFAGDSTFNVKGIMTEATSETLDDATIDSAADVVAAVKEHIAAIPGRFKDLGIGCIVEMTNGLYNEYLGQLNGTTDKNAASAIALNYMNEQIDKGCRVLKVKRNDALSGKTALTTTNQCMLTYIPSADILSKAVSKPLGILGDEMHSTDYEVHVGWMGAGIVKQADAVIKTTSITTASA